MEKRIYRKTRLVLCLCLYLITYISHAHAQTFKEEEEDYLSTAEGLVISEVIIEKPKRTNPDYIALITMMQEGDTYTKELHVATYLRLWEVDIFSIITITPQITEDNTVKVTIYLKDKWTLIPAPIFSTSAHRTEGGLALLETNLLGYNKTLVLVGLYGTTRLLTNLIYTDPELFRSNFELTAVTFFNISQYTDTAYGTANVYNTENRKVNTIIRKSQGLNYSSYFTLGYNLKNNFTPFASLRLNVFDNDITLDEDYETTDNQLESSIYFPIYAGIKYNKLAPYSIMTTGLFAELQYTNSLYSSDGFYQAVIGQGRYSLGLDKRQINLITINGDFAFGNSPLILQSGIGGGSNAPTIPSQSIRSNKFVSTAAEHTIIVWSSQWGGIITGYGANISIYEITDRDGQGAYTELDSPTTNTGVFANIGVRINQIDIPLAKFSVGYNITGQYLATSFSIGTR